MPYLQVDLDGKKRWPMVAVGLGVPEGAVYKGFIDLWEMCWRDKTDRVGALRLELLFGGARGDRIAQVLTELDFLEPAEDGLYRVRGADKRLGIAKAQSEAGKRNAGNLRRGKSPGGAGEEPEGEPERTSGSGPALTPNTQHPTPNTESKSKTKAAEPPTAPTALQDVWNEEAHPDLPRWKETGPDRKRTAKARLKERPIDEWREIIRRISASDFCRGANDRGWRASPDWLLQPATAAKVLEGKYDNRRATGPPPKPGQRVGAEQVNWDGVQSEISHEF